MILPVRDGLPWLEEQLEALSAQECEVPWEVVVADNGSTDGSVEAVGRWSQRSARIRMVDASAKRGPAAARNAGARSAEGELLAFCDADDVVRPGWLSACAGALADADLVAGVFDVASLNGRRPAGAIPAATVQMGFLPAGLASNLAVKRKAFDSVGGFSEELQVGEDFDLCWRLQLAGCRFSSAPSAVVAKREHEDLGAVFHRAVSYGRSGPLLYRRYRSAGARRQLVGWVESIGWMLLMLIRLGDRDVRRQWVRVAGMRVGRLVGSVEHRVFFP